MENSVVFARKKFTMDKFLTQAKVTATSPIKKVLSVSARSSISSNECAGGVVTVGGKVFVNVIYINSEDAIERAGGEVEFIEKQQTEYALEDLFVYDNVTAESTNSTSTEVMVSLAHETTVTGTYKYELANFESAENELVMSKKSFVAMRGVTSASDSFVVAEECDSNIKNMQILHASARAVITEASCSLDKIVLEGKVLSEVFESDGETFGLISKEFDFKQEILAEGTVPNMVAAADVVVKNITVTPEENDEKTTLVYAFDVFAKVTAYEETTYEAVTDMFSLENEITTTNGFIEAKNYHSALSVSDLIMMTTNVSEVENFDDVAGVFGAKYNLVSAEDLGDKLVVSGTVKATALIKVADGYDILPIETATSYEIAKDSSLVVEGVVAAVEIQSYKVKAGKELEASAKVTYSAKFDTLVSETYVSAYEPAKAKNVDEGGIKVYIAKSGETLFEVAKALSVRPEIITRQNEVSDVFEEGEKIYIYSPINLI